MEGSGGGGEVRRIHVVYLLSRVGRMEQPHLFRVHHLARSGVRLKDVKRWLGELRGKSMPDSFSWSYKRRYKTGFVWQDLRDDDLITPISDNEYVLKGSEIHSATVRTNPCCHSNREKWRAVKKLDPAPPTPEKELAGGSSEDPPASITGGNNKELAGKGSECSSPSSSSSLSSFSSSSFAAASECSKEAKPAIGAGGGAGASPGGGVFRSLLSCGVVDTSDASILRGGRRPAGGATPDGLGGSARFFSNSDWFQSSETRMKWRSFSSLTGLSVKPKKKKEKMEDCDELNKEVSEYPVLNHAIEPLCSQCGKGFRPEKLQAHMKSCKGLKSKAKMGSPAATETPSPFATTVNKRSFSFFL